MSETPAILTEGLSKRYPGILAVDSLDLHVRHGEIYGFLGLNGAGKTTTIRALLGMVSPSAGKAILLGEQVGPNGRGPWQRVGHMVESPAAYPELTVTENLEIARRLQRVASAEAVSEVIQQMGLGRYADRKAGVLSSGNFQRLALARAFLHKPDLLLLDEPANGLDPAGVVEIRELLKTMAHEQGITVFMSSHILSEVDRLADRIGVIHEGRLIEEYDAETLEQLRSQVLCIEVREMEEASKILLSAGFEVKIIDDALQLSDPRALEAPDEIATLLVNAGHPPLKLAVEHEDLEEHFLRLTGGTA